MSQDESLGAPLPEALQRFIAQQEWIFAKTYAETWPHEYIVKDRVDAELFAQLADHIDTHGYTESFYKTQLVYFDYGGHTYWHLGIIINRCLHDDTFSRRKRDGRLPPFTQK